MVDRPRRLVFTGEGKGKTTAALGMVLRAAGHGMRVLVVQFIKGDMPSGEIERYGLGFLPEHRDEAFRDHQQAAEGAIERAAGAIRSKEFDLVVLDEVCYAINRGLVSVGAVAECFREAPCHVVMTGRHCPPELVKMADTVTQMRAVKHAMAVGREACRGIEF